MTSILAQNEVGNARGLLAVSKPGTHKRWQLETQDSIIAQESMLPWARGKSTVEFCPWTWKWWANLDHGITMAGTGT